MALSWSGRRQLIYYTVALVVASVLLISAYKLIFSVAPTCFDGVQNGGESGVDCGGSCALLCEETTSEPSPLWTRSFRSGPTTFSAVAYVQNSNVGAGSKNVPYSFKLFDSNNILVVEKTGVIDLPPIPIVPVVETNIDVGNREVVRTLFEFTKTQLVWKKISASDFPTIRITNQNLYSDASRLSATLNNEAVRDIPPFYVAAVLFDAQGIARATSKSYVPGIARKSSADAVFTWPGGVPDVVRAEITVLPSF